MRPVPGDEALAGRSRNKSFGSITTPLARQTQPQMTYFMADEKTMEENLDRAAQTSASRHLREHMKRSSANFGVESMETISSNIHHDSDEDAADQARKRWKEGLMKKRISDEDMLSAYSPSQKSSIADSRNVSPSEHRRRPSHDGVSSHPATPYYLESPMLGSTPSFLRSRRPSEVDFLTDESQAILSGGDDEVVKSPKILEPDSSSQFVMPSIAMPTRRPFTERGKSMARLKIMVAGDSGVGKTSLIKSIVQSSRDIVHVDPFPSTPNNASFAQRRMSRRRSTARNEPPTVPSTLKVSEVFASTRPYPNWWSEAEEVKVLRRRRSSGGDIVLDRNICFVDTPGYSSGASTMDTIIPVIDYIESQYRRTISADLSDSEMVGLLSGGGGPQVDVVLYLFNNTVKPVDIDYLGRLSKLTNVIPIISQSDTRTNAELADLKAQIWSELKIANIRLANLNVSTPGSTGAVYSVSSAFARDDETMDASILMSPDYIQPLAHSELDSLVDELLDPETMSYLRHIAAMKCVKLMKNSTTTILGDSIPLSIPGPAAGYGALQVLRPTIGPTSCYALARIADHTQREEQLARVRLSNWALDLQRSQANERARFAAMARQEQAVWHVDALGELVRAGTLTAFPQLESPHTSNQEGQLLRREDLHAHNSGWPTAVKGGMNHADPLGLLHFNEELISKTWAAVQIVSSVGVIGAVAFWFARNWRQDGYAGVMFNFGGLLADW